MIKFSQYVLYFFKLLLILLFIFSLLFLNFYYLLMKHNPLLNVQNFA